MADPSRYLTSLEPLRESRNLEFTESQSWDVLKEKIAKTAIGMANIRDGGTIIVGVSQRTGQPMRDGMTPEHLSTYTDDDVKDFVHTFADPFVNMEIRRSKMGEKDFLEIVVREFEDVPVICRRDSSTTRRGVLYTRPYGKAGTTEVPTQTEMREILELATDKAVRRLLGRIQSLGFSLEKMVRASDLSRFEEQRGDK